MVSSAIPKVLVVHPGTQYAPRLVAELSRRQMLLRYWTSLGFAEENLMMRAARWLPGRIGKAILRRKLPVVLRNELRTIPTLEIEAAVRMRLGSNVEDTLYRRNAAFQSRVSAQDFAAADAVIGFDTSSWILAERCRNMKRPFVLDQSIGHPLAKEDVYAQSRRRYPEWNDDFVQKEAEHIALEEREHELSTAIAAASTFSRDTLLSHGVPESKVVTIPYGVDLEQFVPAPPREAGAPVRFLFAGLVNARKGIPLLLDCWQKIGRRDAELWLVGQVSPHVRRLIPALPRLRVLGPVVHRELPNIFRQCDVFVFPSFFEGFGLVLLEAMACGLPIIASNATAAPDLVNDAQQGIVVNAGSEEQLSAAMQEFIDHPARIPQMALAARARAEQFSWRHYGDRWATLLRSLT